MNTSVAMDGKERKVIFETILASPGMNEKCKISLQLSRKNILLLGRLIEAGLLSEDAKCSDEILATLPKESVEDLRLLHEEILHKGELTEFYQRLKSL